ncbi:hypothetical protein VKT23_020363 [Stygiomarasmius scandens]|uniref:Uncharacterized protein n=1 Tax=Marasmiellus scandens TaxID=2682957 RepID=A0ABR1IJ94_9AGAR
MSVGDLPIPGRAEIEELMFHPSPGDEHLRGNEGYKFYIVVVGHIPGIYTDWFVLLFLSLLGLMMQFLNFRKGAGAQVIKYSGALHEKVVGWTRAVDTLQAGLEEQRKLRTCRGSARSPGPSPSVSLPSTPAPARRSTQISRSSSSIASVRTPPMSPTRSVQTLSTPPTPSRSRASGHTSSTPSSKRETRMMYILEALGQRPVVYGNEDAAELATQRELDQHGGFEKLEGTDSVKHAIHRVAGRSDSQ